MTRWKSGAILAMGFALGVSGMMRTCRAQLPPDPNFVAATSLPELSGIQGRIERDRRDGRRDRAQHAAQHAVVHAADCAGRCPTRKTITTRCSIAVRRRRSPFPGDHNNWQPNFAPATQLAGTNLWYREGTLPTDARVDYKIVLNGSNLDSRSGKLATNVERLWAEFGVANAELRVPARDDSPAGCCPRHARQQRTRHEHQSRLPGAVSRLHARRL